MRRQQLSDLVDFVVDIMALAFFLNVTIIFFLATILIVGFFLNMVFA